MRIFSTVQWHDQLGYAVLCAVHLTSFCAVCRTMAVSRSRSPAACHVFRGSAGYIFCLDEEVGFAPALVPLLLFLASCCPVFVHELQPAQCIPSLCWPHAPFASTQWYRLPASAVATTCGRVRHGNGGNPLSETFRSLRQKITGWGYRWDGDTTGPGLHNYLGPEREGVNFCRAMLSSVLASPLVCGLDGVHEHMFSLRVHFFLFFVFSAHALLLLSYWGPFCGMTGLQRPRDRHV